MRLSIEQAAVNIRACTGPRQSRAARTLGQTTSPAKRKTSRANGRLGGRTPTWRLVGDQLQHRHPVGRTPQGVIVYGRWFDVHAPFPATARNAKARLLNG